MPMGERRNVYRGTHVSVDFKMDTAGIRACAMGPELKAAVTDIAERRALPYAKSISPRSTKNTPGHVHYQDAFVVKTGTTVIKNMRRVAARLWNMSPHAAAVEYGNDLTPEAHRVLGRTLNYLNGPIVGELASVRLDNKRAARRSE